MIGRSTTWLVCERTGRWAAALRQAIDRRAQKSARTTPQLVRETRNLAGLNAAMSERPVTLNLVEVRTEDYAAVLDLLSSDNSRHFPIVALLEDNLPPDALREAGALAVIDSPRRISWALELANQISSTQPPQYAIERVSIADWAWAALPWQDA